VATASASHGHGGLPPSGGCCSFVTRGDDPPTTDGGAVLHTAAPRSPNVQPSRDQPASQAMAGPARAPCGVDLHRVADGDLHRVDFAGGPVAVPSLQSPG
jgi:hypothetical protein